VTTFRLSINPLAVVAAAKVGGGLWYGTTADQRQTLFKAAKDLRVYLTGSAGAGAGSPAPAGPQILRSARLSSAPSLHLISYHYSRKFQSTDPLVSPLNLQCALLPIGFVSDISRQDHLALSRDVVHDDIENGLEVSGVCFTECKHSAS
jgi:hypothetical protein